MVEEETVVLPGQLCTRLVHNCRRRTRGLCKGRLHDCRLGRLCNRLLHNYGFRPGFSEGPHVFEVAGGKALLAGELGPVSILTFDTFQWRIEGTEEVWSLKSGCAVGAGACPQHCHAAALHASGYGAVGDAPPLPGPKVAHFQCILRRGLHAQFTLAAPGHAATVPR